VSAQHLTALDQEQGRGTQQALHCRKVKLKPVDGKVPEDNRADDDDALGDRAVFISAEISIHSLKIRRWTTK
jgi:hypothetical protein